MALFTFKNPKTTFQCVLSTGNEGELVPCDQQVLLELLEICTPTVGLDQRFSNCEVRSTVKENWFYFQISLTVLLLTLQLLKTECTIHSAQMAGLI